MKRQAVHNRVRYSLMQAHKKCHTAALAAKGCAVYLAITTVLCIPFFWGLAPSCRAPHCCPRGSSRGLNVGPTDSCQCMYLWMKATGPLHI